MDGSGKLEVKQHVPFGSTEPKVRSDSQISGQMDVLNNDFQKAKITWELVNVTRTINPDWFLNTHLSNK